MCLSTREIVVWAVLNVLPAHFLPINVVIAFRNYLSSLYASSSLVSGKELCRATGSATWAHLMAPCGFPTIQVEYRPIVHLPSCSCKTGGWSCLCGLLPQSGKLVHLGYNGLLSHQYVVQERLWGVGLQHGFPVGSHSYFLEACCALQ